LVRACGAHPGRRRGRGPGRGHLPVRLGAERRRPDDWL
jgi:hypothetical protein